MVRGDENPPLAGATDEIAMSARSRLSIIRARLNRCSEHYLLILRSFVLPANRGRAFNEYTPLLYIYSLSYKHSRRFLDVIHYSNRGQLIISPYPESLTRCNSSIPANQSSGEISQGRESKLRVSVLSGGAPSIPW